MATPSDHLTPEERGTLSQVEVRKGKRADLLAADRPPYLLVTDEVHDSLASVVFDHTYARLEPDTVTADVVTVAGRVMYFRSGGKIAFVTLQDGEGNRLQLMLQAQLLGETFLAAGGTIAVPEGQDASDPVSAGKALIKDFGRVVDLGDFVSVTGAVCTTKTGELSVQVRSWRMASKAIRPLPFLHAELSEETRVRQPYLELLTSDEARVRVRQRSRILREVRRAFEDWDYMELETPILQPLHGGALARPFRTHVNALDSEFSLRIALELNLKKAVVGGLERVFEMGKVFRNEGMDSSHSPEFTMLEAYEAYGSMHTMAETMQFLFRRVCAQVAGTEESEYQLALADGTVLDFRGDFAWLSVYEAVSAAVGTPVTSATSAETLRSRCDEHGISYERAWPAGKLVMELCSELVEPTLIQPTFLHDWPAEAQPLAARNPDDPARILAWDLIVNGQELGTAFTELVDPVIQREILTAQSLAAAGGDAEAMELDEDFLRALEFGAPPMGGLGLGIDRLVMLFTQSNIREAILFPLIRPEAF